MRNYLLLIGIPLLVSACNEIPIYMTTQTSSSVSSCIQDLQLSYTPTFNFGEWNLKPIPGTNWTACVPDNSTLQLAQWEVHYDFLQRHPDWIQNGMGILQIPESNSSTWLQDTMPENNPFLHFTVIPVTETWTGSVLDWVRQEFGGRFPNTDICLGMNKSISDYPSPDFINFQTPALQLRFASGDAVKFTACKTTGPAYAIVTNGRVTLLKYGAGSQENHAPSEELIQGMITSISKEVSSNTGSDRPPDTLSAVDIPSDCFHKVNINNGKLNPIWCNDNKEIRHYQNDQYSITLPGNSFILGKDNDNDRVAFQTNATTIEATASDFAMNISYFIDDTQCDMNMRDVDIIASQRESEERKMWGKVNTQSENFITNSFSPTSKYPLVCMPVNRTIVNSYAFCSERDSKQVVICISQVTDNPELAEEIFKTFRWRE